MEDTTCVGECFNCEFDKAYGYVTPIIHGYSGDDECGVKWALFDRDLSIENLEDAGSALVDADRLIAAAYTGWRKFYKGVGRSFGGEPYIKKMTNSRILILQSVGLDI